MKLVLTGRALLQLSIGIWIGCIVFFALSAPEVFKFHEAWNVRAVHPGSNAMVEFPRTISGYLTSSLIARLNFAGTACFFAGAAGLFLSWFPKDNRSMYLTLKTTGFLLAGILQYVLAFVISDEMFRILGSGLMDLISAQPSSDVLRFRYLHGWYSRLAIVQVGLLISLVFFTTFRPFNHFGTNLK